MVSGILAQEWLKRLEIGSAKPFVVSAPLGFGADGSWGPTCDLTTFAPRTWTSSALQVTVGGYTTKGSVDVTEGFTEGSPESFLGLIRSDEDAGVAG